MSTKADFNVDEWDLLRSSPLMASLLVVAASPSGPVGLVQESVASLNMIKQAAGTAQTPLLKALSQDITETMSIPKPPAGATAEQLQEAAAEILRRTSELLMKKATVEEAQETRNGWQVLRRQPLKQPRRADFSASGVFWSLIRKRPHWRQSSRH
jgi:hypothetical protein